MNKLTKVGCSALCGSLAAISAANAGDLTVTGGADLTFSSLGHATTGNPIGMGSNFTLKGSGELDNGWTHDLTIAFTNAGAYSAANIGLGMGGLGKININQGNSGNGIAAYDDKMPTAWEETWGAGLSTGIRLPLGSGASQNIMYTTPSSIPGVTLALTYAHDYGSSDIDDKTTKSSADANKRSYDATLNINPSLGTEILSGLNIFAGASTIEAVSNNAGATTDRYEGVGGLTYSLGPVSVGAQWSGDYTGVDDPKGSAGAVNSYNLYKAHAFGVAFNVNDNLSVSYGEWTHRKAGTTSSETVQGDENTKVIHVTSIQAAYTMGGASLRIADSQADNVSWSSGNNKNATVVSLGLAF